MARHRPSPVPHRASGPVLAPQLRRCRPRGARARGGSDGAVAGRGRDRRTLSLGLRSRGSTASTGVSASEPTPGHGQGHHYAGFCPPGPFLSDAPNPGRATPARPSTTLRASLFALPHPSGHLRCGSAGPAVQRDGQDGHQHPAQGDQRPGPVDGPKAQPGVYDGAAQERPAGVACRRGCPQPACRPPSPRPRARAGPRPPRARSPPRPAVAALCR